MSELDDVDVRSVGSNKSLDSDADETDPFTASGAAPDEPGDDGPRYIVRRRGAMLAIVYLSVFIDMCGTVGGHAARSVIEWVLPHRAPPPRSPSSCP